MQGEYSWAQNPVWIRHCPGEEETQAELCGEMKVLMNNADEGADLSFACSGGHVQLSVHPALYDYSAFVMMHSDSQSHLWKCHNLP